MQIETACLLAGIAFYLAGLVLVWNRGWALKMAGWLIAVAGTFLICASESSLKGVRAATGLLALVLVLLLPFLIGLHYLLSKSFLKGEDSLEDLRNGDIG